MRDRAVEWLPSSVKESMEERVHHRPWDFPLNKSRLVLNANRPAQNAHSQVCLQRPVLLKERAQLRQPRWLGHFAVIRAVGR